MPDTVKNPILDVYTRWSSAVESLVGKGNFSMEDSGTLANEKTKYATLIMLGNSTNSGTLEGDESSTILSFQVDSYARGTKALSTAYEIDSISHQSLVGMGFRRTYGPEAIMGSDSRIKRIVSRYSRIYTGQLLGG